METKNIETESQPVDIEPETDNHGTMAPAAVAIAERTQVDAIIELAGRVQELGQAMDKIRRFILSRALPGDWVRFKSGDDEAVLSLTGAGAERIASALGINFVDWSATKETGTDEYGPWYTWYYETTAVLGKLQRRVMGRASSRDKFFGFANGVWLPLKDVSEPNIRIAAMRSAQKEGVRQLLGLRAISETAAKELGLNLSVVRGWEFGSKGEPGRPAAPTAAAHAAKAELQTVVASIADIVPKKAGSKTKWVVRDDKGHTFDTFEEKLAEAAARAKESGRPVRIQFQPNADPRYAPYLRSIAPETGTEEGADATLPI